MVLAVMLQGFMEKLAAGTAAMLKVSNSTQPTLADEPIPYMLIEGKG
jgi:hypothetical protein